MKFIKEFDQYHNCNINWTELLLDVKQIFLDVADMGFKIIVNEPSKNSSFNVVIYCENLLDEYIEFDFETIRNCILHVCGITNLEPRIYHGYEDDSPIGPSSPPEIIDINTDSIYMGDKCYIQVFFRNYNI